MNISENGKNLIKSFEGCRLTAYKCLATEKYYTIGWGHYGSDVRLGMTITQEEADRLFDKDIEIYVERVRDAHKHYNFNQNQFDALCSFCYNIGSISQLTANNTRSIAEIASKITAYNKSGGAVINGLVVRRKKEYELFTSTVNNTVPSESVLTVPTPTISYGSKGIKVKRLQECLNKVLSTNLVVDGICGKNTTKAIIEFQKKVFADTKEHDGIYGKKTYAKLKELI